MNSLPNGGDNRTDAEILEAAQRKLEAKRREQGIPQRTPATSPETAAADSRGPAEPPPEPTTPTPEDPGGECSVCRGSGWEQVEGDAVRLCSQCQPTDRTPEADGSAGGSGEAEPATSPDPVDPSALVDAGTLGEVLAVLAADGETPTEADLSDGWGEASEHDKLRFLQEVDRLAWNSRAGRRYSLSELGSGEWQPPSLVLLSYSLELDEDGFPWDEYGGLIHGAWKRVLDSRRELLGQPVGDRVRHPLRLLVRAWQNRPVEVEPETRGDRIIPGPLASMPERNASRSQLRLFSTGFGVSRPGHQLRLFDHPNRSGPAFPLEAFELSGGRTMCSGRGGPAPVDLRLFVEAVLSVRTQDRTGQPVAIESKGGMRGLALKLWPGRTLQRRQYEALVRAAEKLDTLWIHLRDQDGRIREGQRIVLVTHYAYPHGKGRGADPGRVRFVVDLPAGSDQGPAVSPRLHHYGNSAPAFRGLLNLAYRWHHPGRTRRPVRGGRHWLQVDAPNRYDRITDDLLIETFFPVSAKRNRRDLVHRARKVLERLEKDGEARVVRGRLLPPQVSLTDE